MPYGRITLLKGKSPDYLRSLADGLHQAMVETLNVPAADRFQIIEQKEPGELIFDRHFLTGERSDDFVLITITVGLPRTTEAKQAFYERLVSLLEASPGIRRDDVMVVISATTLEDWSFGRGISAIAAGR